MTPEKIVEKLVLEECRSLNIDIDVIDSKATFSEKTKTYKKSRSAPVGSPDLWGNTDQGIAVYIELKAQGKIKNLRPEQRLFLEKKVLQGCFACCVDSPLLFREHFFQWSKNGRDYLLKVLSEI
jgi:hypothetical protein